MLGSNHRASTTNKFHQTLIRNMAEKLNASIICRVVWLLTAYDDQSSTKFSGSADRDVNSLVWDRSRRHDIIGSWVSYPSYRLEFLHIDGWIDDCAFTTIMFCDAIARFEAVRNEAVHARSGDVIPLAHAREQNVGPKAHR